MSALESVRQTHSRAYSNPVPLPIAATQTLLLLTAGLFGSIFAWNLLSPISVFLALIVAVAVIGLNFAEGYLVRFAIAAHRFGFKRLGLIMAGGVLLISFYSITAGSNVIASYLISNQQSALASDYDKASAEQRILSAKSEALNSLDFGNAQANFYKTAAEENAKIAAILRNKPANVSSADPSTISKIVSIAIEIGIIGLAAFVEMFIKPTPLPALVKFNDKLIEWNLNESQLKNFEVEHSPSAGTVALPRDTENRPDHVRTRGRGLEEGVEIAPAEAYEEWLYAVRTEEIKPTVTDTKTYLRSVHAYKIEYAQEKAIEYLEAAFKQNFLALNNEGGVGKPKYILPNKKLLGEGV